MAKAAAVPVEEAAHMRVIERVGRGARSNVHSALRLTRSVKGAMKAALEAPASRSQARAPERALVTEAGEGCSRCRLAV